MQPPGCCGLHSKGRAGVSKAAATASTSPPETLRATLSCRLLLYLHGNEEDGPQPVVQSMLPQPVPGEARTFKGALPGSPRLRNTAPTASLQNIKLAPQSLVGCRLSSAQPLAASRGSCRKRRRGRLGLRAGLCAAAAGPTSSGWRRRLRSFGPCAAAACPAPAGSAGALDGGAGSSASSISSPALLAIVEIVKSKRGTQHLNLAMRLRRGEAGAESGAAAAWPGRAAEHIALAHWCMSHLRATFAFPVARPGALAAEHLRAAAGRSVAALLLA